LARRTAPAILKHLDFPAAVPHRLVIMHQKDELDVLIRTAPLIRPHLEALVHSTVEQVVSTIDFYRDSTVISHDELRDFSRDNYEYIMRHDVDSRDAGSPPREMGRAHARRGAPVADLLAAYKIGFALLWDVIINELVESKALSEREAISVANVLFWRAAEFSQQIIEGHREVTTALMMRREHERSALVEAIVSGTLVEQSALWESANRLDIPTSGQFLVAVASADPLEGDPLPEIGDRLRRLKNSSVWRLSPHQKVGIICLPDSDSTPALRAIEQVGTGHVGISPIFMSISDAPRALYLASVALRSKPHPDVRIRRFNDTPVSILVAAAPDAAAAIMRNILGPLMDTPPPEQDTLIETFEKWLECGGSATESARRLFIHPNTVRLRLRKLTELTGRRMDDPASVVELVTAIGAWRLLGDQSIT
jgi:hypothetical protein